MIKEFLQEIINLNGDFTDNILCISNRNVRIVSDINNYKVYRTGDVEVILEDKLGSFIIDENLKVIKCEQNWFREFQYEFKNKHGEIVAWIGKRRVI